MCFMVVFLVAIWRENCLLSIIEGQGILIDGV